MAITISKQKTKRTYLIVFLGVVIVAVIFLVWQRFFQEPSTPSSSLPLPPEEIKINFSVFKNPLIKELQTFPEIPPFEGQMGRTNPLSSY